MLFNSVKERKRLKNKQIDYQIKKCQIFTWRYTNADLKISLYVCVHIKTTPWKFCILNPKDYWAICRWSS